MYECLNCNLEMKRFCYQCYLSSQSTPVNVRNIDVFSPECDLNIVLFPSDGFCFSVCDVERKEHQIKEKHPDNRRSVSVSPLK